MCSTNPWLRSGEPIMNPLKDQLEEAVRNSKRIRAAKRGVEKYLSNYNAANLEKQEHTEKIYELTRKIKRKQGEIRQLGFLCQKINKRLGNIEGKLHRSKVSIRKEEKRLEQKLEDKWVENKRQEFRKSCYVHNLNPDIK